MSNLGSVQSTGREAESSLICSSVSSSTSPSSLLARSFQASANANPSYVTNLHSCQFHMIKIPHRALESLAIGRHLQPPPWCPKTHTGQKLCVIVCHTIFSSILRPAIDYRSRVSKLQEASHPALWSSWPSKNADAVSAAALQLRMLRNLSHPLPLSAAGP